MCLEGLVEQLHQADCRLARPQIPDHDRNQDWTVQLASSQANCPEMNRLPVKLSRGGTLCCLHAEP